MDARGLLFPIILLAPLAGAQVPHALDLAAPVLDLGETLLDETATLDIGEPTAPGEDASGGTVEADAADVGTDASSPEAALAPPLDEALLGIIPHELMLLPLGTSDAMRLLVAEANGTASGTGTSAPRDARRGGSGDAAALLERASVDPAIRAGEDALPPAVGPVDVQPPSPLEGAALTAGTALVLATVSAAALWRHPAWRAWSAAPLAALYSRFTRKDVLQHETRDRILARLHERGGLTLDELRATTGLSRGGLIHHLTTMERHGLVVTRHEGARRRVYAAGVRLPVLGAVPTPGQARVLALLQEAGPLPQGEVARRLGITQQGASHHLTRLAREGRLRVEQEGGERRWGLAEAEGQAPATQAP